MRLDIRGTYLLGCIISILVIVSLMYLRILMLDVYPCPLCLFEFLCFLMAGFFLLILTWFFPSESVHSVTSTLIVLADICGLILSIRHFILLKAANLDATCFMSQEEVVHYFSPSRLVDTFFEAYRSGICQGGADILGVNISVVLTVCFAASLIFIIFQNIRVKKYGMLG